MLPAGIRLAKLFGDDAERLLGKEVPGARTTDKMSYIREMLGLWRNPKEEECT